MSLRYSKTDKQTNRQTDKPTHRQMDQRIDKQGWLLRIPLVKSGIPNGNLMETKNSEITSKQGHIPKLLLLTPQDGGV